MSEKTERSIFHYRRLPTDHQPVTRHPRVPSFSEAETRALYSDLLEQQTYWTHVNVQLQEDFRAIHRQIEAGNIAVSQEWRNLSRLEQSKRIATILLTHIQEPDQKTRPIGKIYPEITEIVEQLVIIVFQRIDKELAIQGRVDTDGQYKYARQIVRILVRNMGESGAALVFNPQTQTTFYS